MGNSWPMVKKKNFLGEPSKNQLSDLYLKIIFVKVIEKKKNFYISGETVN